MGNTLAVAPASDFTLFDLPDLASKRSLGSSRLFKSQLCFSERDLQWYVCKSVSKSLFVPETDLAKIRKELETQKCYARIEENAKAVRLIRPHGFTTLANRVSERPFLTLNMKLWIAFQILNCLKRNAERSPQLLHGDIKTQNIVLSTFSLVSIVDYAPFKPVLVPKDDPTVFSYFFDTTKQRICNIAPERFTVSSQIQPQGAGNTLVNVSFVSDVSLSPAMDVFSAGCVLYFLFTDGINLFNYSSLLNYESTSSDAVANGMLDELLSRMYQESDKKNSKEDADPVDPKEIQDRKNAKLLVKKMLAASPFDRPSAADLLLDHFPRSFSQFYDFCDWSTPDSRCDTCLQYVNESKELHPALYDVICSILCTGLAHLSTTERQIFSLDAIAKLSRFNDECSIPYLLDFASKKAPPPVAANAIRVLARLGCQTFREISNIFFAAETHSLVRAAIATHIGDFAMAAKVQLEQRLVSKIKEVYGAPEKDNPLNDIIINPALTEAEEEQLSEDVSAVLMECQQDPDESVRCAMLSNPLSICAFFGHRKTTSFVLPLFISVLNGGVQSRPRLVFLDHCVPQCAAFLGPMCTEEFLLPLLMQISRSDVRARVSVDVLVDMGLVEARSVLRSTHTLGMSSSHPSTPKNNDGLVVRGSPFSSAQDLALRNSSSIRSVDDADVVVVGAVADKEDDAGFEKVSLPKKSYDLLSVGSTRDHREPIVAMDAVKDFVISVSESQVRLLSLSRLSNEIGISTDLLCVLETSSLKRRTNSAEPVRNVSPGAAATNTAAAAPSAAPSPPQPQPPPNSKKRSSQRFTDACFLHRDPKYRIALSTGQVIDIRGQSDMSFLPCVRVASAAENTLVCVHAFPHMISLFDLRRDCSKPALAASFPFMFGYPSALTVHSSASYCAVGTTLGMVEVFDLRFALFPVGSGHFDGVIHAIQLPDDVTMTTAVIAAGYAGEQTLDFSTLTYATSSSLQKLIDVDALRPYPVDPPVHVRETECRALGGAVRGFGDGCVALGERRVRGHIDAVNVLCETETCLVSGGRDGLIRLWK
eukprot:ANDGO_06187.mRNA.1 putative serine/threonine-protein kinase vps15